MIKRILSITAQKPNSTGSGVYLTELVKAYAALGYEQAVIAGIEQGEEVELGQEISFYPVHFKSDEVPFPVAGMSDVMPYDNTKYCDMTDAMTAVFMEAFKKRIVKAIKEFCPDVILCHHLYLVTALTKSLAGEIPVYGICHSTCLRQFQKNALQKEFIAENIRALDGIFALHSGQKKEILSLFQVPEDKVHIVGAGYNDSIFYTEETGKEPGIHLCFAGKISQAKGVKSLLKSLSMVHTAQNVTLELAGGSADTKEVKELQNLAKNLENDRLKFVFHGKLNQMELAEVYRSSDIFILPSFYEGLPLTMLEAMACGCLVVAGDWIGVKEWINNQVKDADIQFVALPNMEKPGVPFENELPAYEQRLKGAIETAIQHALEKRKQADVTGLSWKHIAEYIVENNRNLEK